MLVRTVKDVLQCGQKIIRDLQQQPPFFESCSYVSAQACPVYRRPWKLKVDFGSSSWCTNTEKTRWPVWAAFSFASTLTCSPGDKTSGQTIKAFRGSGGRSDHWLVSGFGKRKLKWVSSQLHINWAGACTDDHWCLTFCSVFLCASTLTSQHTIYILYNCLILVGQISLLLCATDPLGRSQRYRVVHPCTGQRTMAFAAMWNFCWAQVGNEI